MTHQELRQILNKLVPCPYFNIVVPMQNCGLIGIKYSVGNYSITKDNAVLGIGLVSITEVIEAIKGISDASKCICGARADDMTGYCSVGCLEQELAE